MIENRPYLINALAKKLGPNAKCPICGYQNFHLINEGYNFIPTFDSVREPKPNGQFIPTVMMVCDHCGFMSQHVERVITDKIHSDPMNQESFGPEGSPVFHPDFKQYSYFGSTVDKPPMFEIGDFNYIAQANQLELKPVKRRRQKTKE